MNAEETNEAANYIFSEGKRLESLSLKLLELLVVKNEDTILQPADPAAVIKNVVNITKPELTKANIDLKSTCRKGNCMLDNDLFQSLIINIVDNARKAMDNGGDIHISGTVKDDKYVIIIKDNGRGMPPEEIDRISEAFYRVDKSRSRAQGGAGLGLSICSKIAEIHNATLKFKSEVGRGTVVTISLKQVEG
jgi:signal transduction histidine kinase